MIDDIELLVELWQDLADDAKALSRRIKILPPLSEAAVGLLQLDFAEYISANQTEYRRWIRQHEPALKQTYSLDRLEWLERFGEALGESSDPAQEALTFRVPRKVEDHPWWRWYASFRGSPMQSFPPGLNWAVCLHQYYLLRRREG
jgi:hypothetical protein